MHKGTLGVQQVEFVVKAAPCSRDSGCVGQHAHATGHLGEVASRDKGRGFVANTEFEAGGTPINELDGTLRLDDTNGGVNVLRHDITTVQQRAGHYNST